MESQDLTNILRQNPWFQSLDPHHFQKMVDIASEVSWAEGQIIFGEGEPGDQLYLVTEGRVALEIYVPDRGRRTILTIGPDEVFGWSAVTPFVRTRMANARAVAPTKAIAFDSPALSQACEEDHELGYYVYRRLTNIIAGRLSATRLQLIDMYASAGK
ncbi:MAG: cyclic nucleotide-binding domain-containing protein [Candidatus Promineifilaceae bacterium]